MLEHFHVYQTQENATTDISEPTLDWHTDQGLLLIFSPGVLLSEDSTRIPPQDFFIRLPDGSPRAVQFTRKDELVILLGEGIEQYVNPN